VARKVSGESKEELKSNNLPKQQNRQPAPTLRDGTELGKSEIFQSKGKKRNESPLRNKTTLEIRLTVEETEV